MSDEHLDHTVLVSLQEIMEDDFSLLLETFITDSIERLAQLQKAFAQDSADDVRRVSHSLKGSAGNVGAFRLAELCLVVETASSGGVLDGQQAAIEAIAHELTMVNQQLAKFL